MKKIVLSLPVAVMTLALVGCSDPKAANKNNFLKAINADNNCYGFYDPAMHSGINAGFGDPSPFVAATMKAGLVVKVTRDLGGNNPFLLGAKETVYTLTPQGEEWWKADGQKAWNATDKRLCFGKRVPTEVVEFTDPQNRGESQVKYKWQVKDAPSWVKGDAFAGLPGVKEPAVGMTVLRLMGDGWKEDERVKAMSAMFGG